MKHRLTGLLCVAALVLPACDPNADPDQTAGAIFGGALAAITLAAIDADPEWIIIGTAAGAAAGALIAQNSSTGECAYSDGRGGYYRADCP
ncbi:MAG: glucose-6-phosphate isomerase [Rhodobacter sp.]|nr:glucose-6-phosphate isomerase [Rhodobacter sp.]